ncbi:MAG: heavy metal-associated domain-containing protein [Ignavibacteriota bacterium]
MKSIKNIALAITIVVITGILISGCTKNETKNNVAEKEVTKQDTQKKVTETMNQKTENTDDMKDMKNDAKDNKNVEHTMVKIPSAQCETCEKNLNNALKKVAGIGKFKVDIEGKVIHINYDRSTTTIAKIENAITSAGYDANDKKANPDAYDKLDKCCKKPEDRGK